MKALSLALLALSSFNAFANPEVTQIKVMEVSTEETGTVFGLRLNRNVNRDANPQALDVEFECNPIDGNLKIVFCDDDYCDTFDGPTFYEFDEPGDCFDAQKELKKTVKKSYEACLRLETRDGPHGRKVDSLIIDSAQACR